jgi:3-phytase
MSSRHLAPSLALLALPLAHARAQVQPTVETFPVPSTDDAADDAVVWVHPTDPSLSTIIGTDKEAGLAVYDLAGNQLQFLPHGRQNNVDLRRGFPLGATTVALVTSGERNANLLTVYAVDPGTRLLAGVAAAPIVLGIDVYGCCMYRSPVTGDTYFFGTSDSGVVEQWRLNDDGAGAVVATLVRTFDVGGQCEGCVADDENAWFFVGEEDVGIWRYGAEPGDVSPRVQVDTTGGGHLAADVEGLSIYYAAGGGGYLLASSQGNSTYAVYDRAAPHAFRMQFSITDNATLGIDGVSGTDGIDVMNLALGPAFPEGAFVAQDDTNPGGNQNYKLVPWSAIAGLANPPLVIDTTHAPVGGGPPPPPAGWVPFCLGDGTGAPCPCGNIGSAGHGCASSTQPGGALLAGGGTPSVSADTFALTATSLTGNSCIFFQGDAEAAPFAVDDGLGCVGGFVRRLGTKHVGGGSSSYPHGNDPPISVRGALPPAGGTRWYQVYYRNAASFCTPATSNRANGVRVIWAP